MGAGGWRAVVVVGGAALGPGYPGVVVLTPGEVRAVVEIADVTAGLGYPAAGVVVLGGAGKSDVYPDGAFGRGLLVVEDGLLGGKLVGTGGGAATGELGTFRTALRASMSSYISSSSVMGHIWNVS